VESLGGDVCLLSVGRLVVSSGSNEGDDTDVTGSSSGIDGFLKDDDTLDRPLKLFIFSIADATLAELSELWGDVISATGGDDTGLARSLKLFIFSIASTTFAGFSEDSD